MNLHNCLLLSWFFIIYNHADCLVEIKDLMPHGPNSSDIDYVKEVSQRTPDLDDGSSIELKIDTGFKFFGETYKSLWVNINGGVSFKMRIHQYNPKCEALSQDMCMISPFWADVDLRDENQGKLYYRQTTDPAIMHKAKTAISKAFPSYSDLGEMKWAFVATWLEVPFYDVNECKPSPLKNTFQMTLVTDNKYSFTIFYYNRIQWTTGTASGAPDCSGLGGQQARAGFDNGLGTMFKLDGSCNAEIIHVNDRSLGGPSGVYILRVDQAGTIVGPNTQTLATVTNPATFTIPSKAATTKPAGTTRPVGTTLSTLESDRKDLVDDIHQLYQEFNSTCIDLLDRASLQSRCFQHWLELINELIEANKVTEIDELNDIEQDVDDLKNKLDIIRKDIKKFPILPPLKPNNTKADFVKRFNEVTAIMLEAYHLGVEMCPRLIEYPAIQQFCFKNLKELDNELIEVREVKEKINLDIVREKVSDIKANFEKIEKEIDHF